MSSSDKSNCNSSDSSDSDSSGGASPTGRSHNNKKFAKKRLQSINYFFDKFGMCKNCQDIYWEMRHTLRVEDCGSHYSYEWSDEERLKAYEKQELQLDHKEVMRQYQEKLLHCQDCPRNKDTPCSLKDQAYSCISQIIGKIAIEKKREIEEKINRAPSFCSTLNYMEHKIYNNRVSKLPILDGMVKELEAKPCKWESSSVRQICSTLVAFEFMTID